MKTVARNFVSLMSIGLLCLGAASQARAEEPNTVSVEVSEALKAVAIQAKLIGKLGTDALRISVRVAGPTATLTGEVTNKSSQKLAEAVALSVDGIKKVDNQVTQKNPPEKLANAEANVKDAILLTRVKTILLTDIGVNALKIDVDVTNGVVSLRGTLGNTEVNDEALKKTRSIKGVKKVVNLLT
jgi:hyperosmotically inducible periplasmic protein